MVAAAAPVPTPHSQRRLNLPRVCEQISSHPTPITSDRLSANPTPGAGRPLAATRTFASVVLGPVRSRCWLGSAAEDGTTSSGSVRAAPLRFRWGRRELKFRGPEQTEAARAPGRHREEAEVWWLLRSPTCHGAGAGRQRSKPWHDSLLGRGLRASRPARVVRAAQDARKWTAFITWEKKLSAPKTSSFSFQQPSRPHCFHTCSLFPPSFSPPPARFCPTFRAESERLSFYVFV